jgi:fermentation-respiration switch protein FrsA (DUF1100 family)
VIYLPWSRHRFTLPDDRIGQALIDDASASPRQARAANDTQSIWSRVKFWLARISTLAALICLGFLTVLYFLQGRMIFPGAGTQGQQEARVRSRGDTELLDLTTSGGERVAALFGPALTADRQPDPRANLRPTMTYFYGNAMCLNYATDEFDRFRRLGLNVLIPDYVGYGMSGGTPSERGCQATADAAYDYLVSRRRVDPQQIITAGWSLGGAVAIDLASRRTVGGLIAFSTFTSTSDMARTILPIKLPGWFFAHRFDSLHKIPKISCPNLLGHGRRDTLVPFAMFERLAAAARSPTTTLVIDAAGHNDFYDEGGRRIDDAIAAFVANHF